ncbi:MAG: NusG domain II-containing protein [Deltaproteobacteria bacterium]|nr:NusG domain II-containing protein [Deltaproteobacteria bacterium]
MRARGAFTAWDALVVGALVAVNLFLLLRPSPEPAALEVSSDAGTRVLALGPRRRVDVPGPLGVTTVELDPAGARVVASPCPNRLCLRAGRISRPGQVVACVPNRVALRLVGPDHPHRRREAVDAVTR